MVRILDDDRAVHSVTLTLNVQRLFLVWVGTDYDRLQVLPNVLLFCDS